MGATQTAAVAAIVFAALLVGNQIGDHVVQGNLMTMAKAGPSDNRLAAGDDPWRGWRPCLVHAGTTALIQAVAPGLVWLVAPFTVAGGLAAVTLSGASHAVIDRRWIVQMIVRAKGCAGWDNGPYLVGQSLHHGAHLVAAVVAAAVTSRPVTGITCVAAGSTVLAALAVERRRARTAAGRIGDSQRL